QADVGISLGSGTDVALKAGNIILVKNNLWDIITAFDLAKRTVRKIRQNIAYAFAYNIILIPLAGLGMLYPALAGAAMAASSVSVTTSSLLLKRWNPKKRPQIYITGMT
ncbi:MAG: heavy metal translocating P-type ATPase, partial [Thaumarchaeota archaeon]|nr:heavy metal translocating P-type ATPase [Nitrososphaerota archaeon]